MRHDEKRAAKLSLAICFTYLLLCLGAFGFALYGIFILSSRLYWGDLDQELALKSVYIIINMMLIAGEFTLIVCMRYALRGIKTDWSYLSKHSSRVDRPM